MKDSHERIDVLLEWKKTGGVLVMGYQLFRLLVSYAGRSKKLKEAHEKCLVNPGNLVYPSTSVSLFSRHRILAVY